MKKDIHPEYMTTTVTCASCKTTFQTRSTIPEINVEICSVCHPFYTGKQKLIDTAGRVDRFKERVKASQQIKGSKPAKKSPESVELDEGALVSQTVESVSEDQDQASEK